MPPFDSTNRPPAPLARDASLRALANEVCQRNVAYIESLLNARRDVLEESRKDLKQEVLLVLRAEVEATGREPGKVRGFVKQTVRRKVADHKKKRRPDRADGADAALLPATSTESDPQGTAELNELLQKLDRYCTGLPDAWVEALRCAHVGMSLDETAEALGRPRATVYSQLRAATAKLREIARDSERAAAETAGLPEIPSTPSARPAPRRGIVT